MAEFEDLQQLWQQQKPRAMPMPTAAELSDAFHRYGRRQDAINSAKAIASACLFIFLVLDLRDRPLALLGVLILFFSITIFLVFDWRTQRAIARLNFAAPSIAFVRTAIASLQAQRNPFHRREFYIAMGGVWIGYNLLLTDLGPQMTFPLALPSWVVVPAVMLLAFFLGRWIRGKRFENDCRPLIDRLQAVLQTMEAEQQ